MIVKKPIAILSTSSTLQNLSFHQPQSSASLCPRRLRQFSSPQQQRRLYAQAAANSSLPAADDDAESSLASWPNPQPPNAVPTPYQILAHTRSTPYSKRRYYELVKLYHPDRSSGAYESRVHASIYALPSQIRLERYRLIVSAHEILSDPVKKKAYDAWGAGWAGTPDFRSGPYGRRSKTSSGSNGGGETEGDEGPFRNGTWEDWERWRARNEAPPQSPVFISNLAFAALILMLATLGGVGQATRAEMSSVSFLEQRDIMHDQTSKELRRIRTESRGLTRDERIEAFIRSRDAAMGASVAVQEEQARKMLPDMQFCNSEDLARRPPEFWSRNKKSGD